MFHVKHFLTLQEIAFL